MTTFIKANLKKSDEHTSIEKYRVAADRVAKLSTFYLTLSGKSYPVWNRYDNSKMPKFMN